MSTAAIGLVLAMASPVAVAAQTEQYPPPPVTVSVSGSSSSVPPTSIGSVLPTSIEPTSQPAPDQTTVAPDGAGDVPLASTGSSVDVAAAVAVGAVLLLVGLGLLFGGRRLIRRGSH